MQLVLFITLLFAITILAGSIDTLQEEYAKEQYKLRKDTCHRKPEYGNCKGHRSMWYFNIDRLKCAKFNYSNCGGNRNRFFTREDCEEYCKGFDLPK
ncbi:hypothetical protein KR026_012496, partial [Drosophila bipectinata]